MFRLCCAAFWRMCRRCRRRATARASATASVCPSSRTSTTRRCTTQCSTSWRSSRPSSTASTVRVVTHVRHSVSSECDPNSDCQLVAPRLFCDVNGGNRIQTGFPRPCCWPWILYVKWTWFVASDVTSDLAGFSVDQRWWPHCKNNLAGTGRCNYIHSTLCRQACT